jgi:hypothetical protein
MNYLQMREGIMTRAITCRSRPARTVSCRSRSRLLVGRALQRHVGASVELAVVVLADIGCDSGHFDRRELRRVCVLSVVGKGVEGVPLNEQEP